MSVRVLTVILNNVHKDNLCLLVFRLNGKLPGKAQDNLICLRENEGIWRILSWIHILWLLPIQCNSQDYWLAFEVLYFLPYMSATDLQSKTSFTEYTIYMYYCTFERT
jgi:hypothetical protein